MFLNQKVVGRESAADCQTGSFTQFAGLCYTVWLSQHGHHHPEHLLINISQSVLRACREREHGLRENENEKNADSYNFVILAEMILASGKYIQSLPNLFNLLLNATRPFSLDLHYGSLTAQSVARSHNTYPTLPQTDFIVTLSTYIHSTSTRTEAL